MSCISSDLVKLYDELRSQDTQCLYALIETDLVKTVKNVTKFNLRITAKFHAHLQTLTKTPVKFQKDPAKTVGEIAFTTYPVSNCLKPQND